jgi:hypothetical protein
MTKKPYERPAVTHTEKLEGRAAVCDKADDAVCTTGPLSS